MAHIGHIGSVAAGSVGSLTIYFKLLRKRTASLAQGRSNPRVRDVRLLRSAKLAPSVTDASSLQGASLAGAGGDFSGSPGESDMLTRDSSTGAFEIYDIRHNAITSAVAMGQVGVQWTVAGFGDFSGNATETDMLMRNSNTGTFEVYDISDNAITSAAAMGLVGLDGRRHRRVGAGLMRVNRANHLPDAAACLHPLRVIGRDVMSVPV
jgi:hypothetical protein